MNWDLLNRGNSVTQTLAVSFRSILICINDFGNLTMKVCDDLTFSSKLLQSFTFCKSLIVVYLQERSILHLPTPCQTLIWDVIATEAALSRKNNTKGSVWKFILPSPFKMSEFYLNLIIGTFPLAKLQDKRFLPKVMNITWGNFGEYVLTNKARYFQAFKFPFTYLLEDVYFFNNACLSTNYWSVEYLE